MTAHCILARLQILSKSSSSLGKVPYVSSLASLLEKSVEDVRVRFLTNENRGDHMHISGVLRFVASPGNHVVRVLGVGARWRHSALGLSAAVGYFICRLE